jgi:hypothetical protein
VGGRAGLKRVGSELAVTRERVTAETGDLGEACWSTPARRSPSWPGRARVSAAQLSGVGVQLCGPAQVVPHPWLLFTAQSFQQ